MIISVIQHFDTRFLPLMFTPHCLHLSDETISRWSLLYGVYARESKRSHTAGKCVTCRGLHILEKDNSLNHSCVSPGIGCLEYIAKGSFQNCHHFRESSQHTLGGKEGARASVRYLKNVYKWCIAIFRRRLEINIFKVLFW